MILSVWYKPLSAEFGENLYVQYKMGRKSHKMLRVKLNLGLLKYMCRTMHVVKTGSWDDIYMTQSDLFIPKSRTKKYFMTI